MAMPLINPLPPAPTPADPEPVFDDKAYETVAALAPFVEQANALAVAVEGQAERSKTEADRSQAQVSAATVEANRAKTEADRSKDEANRSQLAADNAVAVTTGGTASLEPSAGKIPIAGADATVKQAWIKDLEFELDALRVATNKTLYEDGPYPVFDFQFQGARLLDPRIKFSRASKDWDWDGKEYGINEPVLTDKGLWSSGVRENLAYSISAGGTATLIDDGTKGPFGRSGRFLAQGAEDTASPSGARSNLRILSGAFEQGQRLTLSLYLKAKEGGSSRIEVVFFGASTKRTSIDLTDKWERYTVTFDVEQSLTLTTLIRSLNHLGGEFYIDRYPQIEFGSFYTPNIPAEGSQVIVGTTNAIVNGGLSPSGGTFFFSAFCPVYSNFNTLLGVGNSNGEEARIQLASNYSLTATVRADGALFNIASLANSLSMRNAFKGALSYEELANGEINFKLYLNGEYVGSAILSRLPTGFTSSGIAIGKRRPNNNDLYWNENIKNIIYFSEVLTETQIKKLTR